MNFLRENKGNRISIGAEIKKNERFDE